MSGLEPITETVRAFDSVKNPLEEWCLQTRSRLEELPPLEVSVELLSRQQCEFEGVYDDIVAHEAPVAEAQRARHAVSQRYRGTLNS